MTKGRNLKGIEEAATLFSNISLPSELAPKPSPEHRGYKWGYDGGIKKGAQCVANNCKEKNESSQVLENGELVRIKNPVCASAQTGRIPSTGLEPYQENPIKQGVLENEEGAGGLNGGYLNIERNILELFLLLDSGRQLEVVDVLARLARQGVEMAAGRGVGR